MFGATAAQAGRSQNEDAFLIGRGVPLFAALCDGAGNAERAAKRVLALFEKLVKKAGPGEIETPEAWSRWVKILDSSLLGASQSTFLAVASEEDRIIGVCAGDSKAYLFDRNGEVHILTEGADKRRLGSGSAVAFPITCTLAAGSTLLLCSDGVWTVLGGYLLRKTVLAARMKNFADMPSVILEAAGKNGRIDDQTAVCMRMK
jgi:serine/threonine protein phosphatase PrpC